MYGAKGNESRRKEMVTSGGERGGDIKTVMMENS